MDKKEFKVGTFVWWETDRVFKNWAVHGVVTKVDDKEVTIKTFDNFKETTISLNGEAVKKEIKIVPLFEVIKHIQRKKEDNIKKLADLEAVIDHCSEVLDVIESHATKESI